jgi:DNA-binding transcriptional LysR family regulator
MIELPDFARDDVDVAIQWGFGNWKDFEQTLLVLDPKVPCCAPALAGEIRTPNDLLSQTLLHPVLANTLWQRALRHLGVDTAEPANAIQFQDAATMRRATMSGLGVGLLSILDAAEDIQAGRLVAPFGLRALEAMPASEVPGFYMIIPRAHRRVKSVSVFCEWAAAQDWAEDLRAITGG